MRQVLWVISHITALALFLFVSSGFGFADLRYGEKVVTVVTTQKVNLWASPEKRPETIMAQVTGGTQLRLLETAADWFKVGLPNGEIAWLSAVYGREDVARDLVKVKVAVARIREQLGLDSAVVSKAEKGTFLHPLEVKDGWVKVRLPDDSGGWIRGDLVEVQRVSRDDVPGERSTQTLILLASVGTGVSAISFVLVLTTVFRKSQRNSKSEYYA